MSIFVTKLEWILAICSSKQNPVQALSALEKLKWVLEYQPKLLTRVSNKMAASFLGLDPSTLSRLKTQL